MPSFDRPVVSLPSGTPSGQSASGNPVFVRARAAETGGTLGVWDALVPQGAGLGWHTHTLETEVFRVDRGTFRFWCGAERFTLGPGAVIALPPYVPHQWENVGAEPGSLLGIVTPGGYEQHFIELGQAVKPTPKAIAALDERLGIVEGPYGPAIRPQRPGFTHAIVSQPDQPRLVHSFGDRQILHLTAAETDGIIGVYEAHDVPGQGPPWHVHAREDEMFRILAGTYRFEIGDDIIEAGPSATIVAPRGVRHRWQNIGDSNGLLFFVVTPGGFEGFFADMAALSSPDGASMAALQARYGMSPA